MNKSTYTFQITFFHFDLTSLQCQECTQNFSPVVIEFFPTNVLVRFISKAHDFFVHKGTIGIVTEQCPYPWKQWRCRLKGTSEIRGLEWCSSTATFQWKAYLKKL